MYESHRDKISQHLLYTKYRQISKSIKNDIGRVILSRAQVSVFVLLLKLHRNVRESALRVADNVFFSNINFASKKSASYIHTYIHTYLLILQPNWLDCGAQYTLKI